MWHEAVATLLILAASGNDATLKQSLLMAQVDLKYTALQVPCVVGHVAVAC